ncbi:MAG: macro domain-containing protein, partial [Clostridiales bacterium]|nr:macro domain-containing protein [Clostridiales bacterium]
MPFKIIRNDITKIKADAIVNTANPEPVYMAGTDAAIYRAAGEDRLLEARRKIGTIGEGMVAVTPAFDLDATYIFHTVGPSWQGGGHGEADTVRCCYENCLAKAAELDIESIAFPLIATGAYGFPKTDALLIATSAFSAFLTEHELDITLVVFDGESFELSGKIFRDIDELIDERYVEEQFECEYGMPLGA